MRIGSTVWRNILSPLADITHATLITYDRPGFGRSGLDANRHGIVNGVTDLEAEGDEAVGDKVQAIANYQHSLKLDPGNKHATERLRVLQVPR